MGDPRYVLILYYTGTGHVGSMAKALAKGVESEGVDARLRVVPNISSNSEKTEALVPDEGAIYSTVDDLANCSGLMLGSPGRFGNMAAPLKHFLEQASAVWMAGQLVDKPAGVFTSTASMHGGQESTLLSMMLPLFHHGMILVGLPYSLPELAKTARGGTPYGASHVSGDKGVWSDLTADELELCFQHGKRVARLVD